MLNVWQEPAPRGYWRNPRGDLVREANISATDRDQDEVAKKIHGFGRSLAGQLYRFREHSRDDIAGLLDRVIAQYGGKIGGRKGNVTLTSFDGCLRVQLAIAEEIAVGPEVEAARALVDECVSEWSERSNLKLRALIQGAFRPSTDGRISATQLLRLRRVKIDDERWRAAQEAISDALRPVGRAEYVRLYHRESPERPWEPLSLHLAAVRRPEGEEERATAEEQLANRVRSAVEEARRAGLNQGAIRVLVNSAATLRPRRVPSAPESEPAAPELAQVKSEESGGDPCD